MRWLADLFWLIRLALTEYRKKKHRDTTEHIKKNTADAWAARFGQLQSDTDAAEQLPSDRASATSNQSPGSCYSDN